jgi:cold shock CspA family protein
MTNDDHNNKRRKSCQTGWLKLNRFRDRGFGLIECDDGGREVFVHISRFRGIDDEPLMEDVVYGLQHRRRLSFRLDVDPKRDRIVAADVTILREVQAPDGTIIELVPYYDKARKQVEAKRAAKLEQVESQPRSDGFGSLVAALR